MIRTNTSFTIPKDCSIKNKILNWSQNNDAIFWLDSNDNQNSSIDAILSIGVIDEIRSDYKNAFEQLKHFSDRCKDYVFGYLGYDLKNDTENISSNNEDHCLFDDLYFVQPLKIIEIKNDTLIFKYPESLIDAIEIDYDAILNSSAAIANKTTPITVQPKISKTDYIDQCKKVIDQIHLGEIYEMNLCQEFFAKDASIAPLATYKKLNDISQAPFACYVKNRYQHLLCASPERFIKKQHDKIISQPIKGTAPRFKDDAKDNEAIHHLKNNTKEIAENVMIVDLVRNDLSHIAKKGSVTVDELCAIYSFKQVHQMISTISCEVKNDIHPVDIIKHCFPMGSMTGAPKYAAMQFIEQFEESKRGLYSGAVGYITPNGDFDFNVVIRSILYNETNKYVSYSVGSAITAKANPEQEYQECLLKAKAMKKVLS